MVNKSTTAFVFQMIAAMNESRRCGKKCSGNEWNTLDRVRKLGNIESFWRGYRWKIEKTVIQPGRECTKSEPDHNQFAINATNDWSETSAVVKPHISLRSSPSRFDILWVSRPSPHCSAVFQLLTESMNSATERWIPLTVWQKASTQNPKYLQLLWGENGP